jgi:hypothetical protein
MKIIINIICIYCCALPIFAQPTNDLKRDYIWKIGYAGFAQQPNYQLMTLYYNQSPIGITGVYASANFNATNTSICDSFGNLVFYTNGIYVYDKNDALMSNNILNLGTQANQNIDYGYDIPQGVLVLPMPNNPYLYYLFHQRYAEPDNIGDENIEGAYYTVIDSRLRNGAGGIATWRTPIIQNDSLEYGKLNACRHANGRDWWLTFWRYGYKQYRRCLLDATGFHDYGWQQISNLISDTGIGQSCFSPDGNVWAGSSYVFRPPLRRSRIDVLDFDRCTGLFSNRRQFFSAIDSIYCAGLSISPNSRYLYTASPTKMLQYDLQASDISTSNITVANWDGFRDSTFVNIGFSPLPTTFRYHQLAPDGRIYISTGNSTKYLHTINNPNEAGLACNVAQHSILLSGLNVRSIPNFPNFRLGALAGSACDTIYNSTSGSPPLGDLGGISVFPNPTNGMLNIEIPPNIKGIAYLYNALGQSIKTIPLTNQQTQTNTNDLSNGIYFLSVLDANGRFMGRQRVVVQHE